MASPDHIERLPVELRQMLLKRLPDINSLIATIHASPSMRAAFFSHAGPICYDILSREMDNKNLPIAVALYHAQSANWTTNEIQLSEAELGNKVVAFCNNHLHNHRSAVIDPRTITLEMAISISGFHQLAQDIAGSLAGQLYWGDKFGFNLNRSEWPPSLVKCVYILELVRLVMPIHIEPVGWQPTWFAPFWRCFAPWEARGVRLFERCMLRTMVKKSRHTCNIDPSYLGDYHAWVIEQREYSIMMRSTSLSSAIIHLGMKRFRTYLDSPTLTQEFVDSTQQLSKHAEFRKKRNHIFARADEAQHIWYGLGRGSKSVTKAAELARQYTGDDTGPRDFWLWSEITNSLGEDSRFHELKESWVRTLRFLMAGNHRKYWLWMAHGPGPHTRDRHVYRELSSSWCDLVFLETGDNIDEGDLCRHDREVWRAEKPLPAFEELIEEAERVALLEGSTT
ncbi:hypothetical protein F5B20DRAFT_592715 [Whalleya microplaca]|nr:hypothetical protein F5B20DRAFT_592715 [Whalleya microplaca]